MADPAASTEISEAGFIGMSHYADALELGARDGTGDDRRTDASDLQTLLVEEIRARPLRAIGWAAVAGLAIGLWAAR